MKNSEDKYPIYTFSSFTEEKARRAFGLKVQMNPNDFLDEWLENAAKQTVEVGEGTQLQKLQNKLSIFVRGWNEQELRERFIIPVVELVDFDMYQLEVVAFSEREMKVTYKKSIIQGKVEWMVATGIGEPQQPFFFIHEYKKEKDASNDPVGQILATLYTAQLLNNQKPKPSLFNPSPSNFSQIPLYGCYIVGRFWFFMRLKGEAYYISKAYDSLDKDDLQFILKMLKAQKQMIMELVQKN
ncbi:MAG: hypothetical protein ACPGVB_06070 [Chitinophagales bacterium]